VPLTGLQAEGWTFPLSYPATVHYRGEEGLVITTGIAMAPKGKGPVAIFDPRTQSIRFNRPGKVALIVQSGGLSKRFMLEGK
jgi:hypothetical protein